MTKIYMMPVENHSTEIQTVRDSVKITRRKHDVYGRTLPGTKCEATLSKAEFDEIESEIIERFRDGGAIHGNALAIAMLWEKTGLFSDDEMEAAFSRQHNSR